jgi:serine kinase of HPr protein (carbohydrate metabolism regulator)
MIMTVNAIAEQLKLECLCNGDGGREVGGAYVGDLLSWVMGRAGSNSAWITIMSNVNVAAVAVLAEVSMIILAENVKPDADLLKRAQSEKLNVYKSPLSAYELSWRLHNIIDKSTAASEAENRIS